jgi:NAD(P)-dependent dehydrogenase (short-subunit alcohol dehydrogenase family)
LQRSEKWAGRQTVCESMWPNRLTCTLWSGRQSLSTVAWTLPSITLAWSDRFAGIVETTEEDWNRVVAMNLTGVWLCMKYEIPEMLKRGRSAIVNNGSVTGLVGAAGVVGNVASKHGVSGLTKSAALQYATQGIRVNAVAPGLVRTPTAKRITTLHSEAEKAMLSTVPQGRRSKPEEVAEAVVFLCSERGSAITGHIMPVDGGWTAR